jgi:hypothetical protein
VNLIKDGARILFGGARKGNRPMVGLGGVMLAMGWVRTRYRPNRELLFSRTLRKGDAIRIRMLGTNDPAEGEITIEG